jgi:hypothetical protein
MARDIRDSSDRYNYYHADRHDNLSDPVEFRTVESTHPQSEVLLLASPYLMSPTFSTTRVTKEIGPSSENILFRL